MRNIDMKFKGKHYNEALIKVTLPPMERRLPFQVASFFSIFANIESQSLGERYYLQWEGRDR